MRALNDVERPVGRLVCAPHSGGSAATYRPWSSVLPAGTQLLAVQYPGHADRMAEPPAASVAEMGRSVAAELLELDSRPCALFGHSLGALVAYETARALQESGRPVGWLFVSGSPAPWQAGGGTTHRAGDEELWNELRGLSGIEPEVAQNTELRDLLLPVLRSDITLNETYRPAPNPEPLRCPVRCYYNAEDPLVDPARLDAWAAVTTASFRVRALPGGHFRLLSDPADLLGDIVAALTESEAVR
ncbi:thioesterase II family protein [Streptomyces sp.]|uniref:thioesterase II family protein n=1 Tax=Streptomyces sp. TaxID=1931 RepID=UPI002D544E37|nr:alpha/beta fold hydrolase [Streptomyces sp.]HZF89879.1 alpha/beta fold hydrolase [Streptomyces sp.]